MRGLPHDTVKAGQKYGHILVKKVYRSMEDGQRRVWATCECVCGKVWEVRSYFIASNKTKSCGCQAKRKRTYNILKEKFGEQAQIQSNLTKREAELMIMCSDGWAYPGMPDAYMRKKLTLMYSRTKELIYNKNH